MWLMENVIRRVKEYGLEANIKIYTISYKIY